MTLPLKARIAELEQRFRFSLQDHTHNAKEWAGKIAIQGAALHKASDMFNRMFRNPSVPDDMRGLAMAGLQLCDKAVVEAGWPPLESLARKKRNSQSSMEPR